MAIYSLTLGTPSSSKVYVNTDVDETEDTSVAGSSVVQGIEIDNTANSAATYVKMVNATAVNVTPGTTSPGWVFLAPKETKISYMFPVGTTMDAALTVWAVTTAGTPGTTGPTSAVTVRILVQ